MDSTMQKQSSSRQKTPSPKQQYIQASYRQLKTNSNKDSFLGNYVQTRQGASSQLQDDSSSQEQVQYSHLTSLGQNNNVHQLNKLDLAYRLSTLAIENQNHSVTEDMLEVSHSIETHPMMMTMTQRHTNNDLKGTRDDSDESKTTNSIQQSAADRRKIKRETLANYLKASEKPVMPKKVHQQSLSGRNSGLLTRKQDEQPKTFNRQSSKTSVQSQSSTQKYHSRSGNNYSSSTPQKYTPSSAGKQIRRLGKNLSQSRTGTTVATSIEMSRTGGSKITAYRNQKDVMKSSFDPGQNKQSSQSPMERNIRTNQLYIPKEEQCHPGKACSDDDRDDDNKTPRQMELGVFQSKNSSIVYDADSQKIITSQHFQRSIGTTNGGDAAVAQQYNIASGSTTSNKVHHIHHHHHQGSSNGTASQRHKSSFSYGGNKSSCTRGKNNAGAHHATSSSLSKHKLTAVNLKKRNDYSVDNTTVHGDQTDDLIKSHYTSNTSQDHIKMKQTPVPIDVEHHQRDVFATITNSTRYLSKDAQPSTNQNQQQQTSYSTTVAKRLHSSKHHPSSSSSQQQYAANQTSNSQAVNIASSTQAAATTSLSTIDQKPERRKKMERKGTTDSGLGIQQPGGSSSGPKEITNFGNQPYVQNGNHQASTSQNNGKGSLTRAREQQNNRQNSSSLAKQNSGSTLPSVQMLSIDKAPIPSARSPVKMASGGLKSAKNADGTGGKPQFTFLPVSHSMNQSLLDEITQLKQANKKQEAKYNELLSELQQDNCDLRNKLLKMDSIIEQEHEEQVTQFKLKCEDWQSIVDHMGHMTIGESTGFAAGRDSEKKRLLSKIQEQEEGFFQATETFEQALKANSKTIQNYDTQLKQRNEQLRAIEAQNQQMKDQISQLQQQVDGQRLEISDLTSQNQVFSAKVKSTQTFQQLLKNLKNELEQQQIAFDKQTTQFQKKETEFEELKRRVSQHLGALAEKDQEIIKLQQELKYRGSEISEKDVEVKKIEEHNLNLKGRICQLESTDRINQTYKQELQQLEQHHQRNQKYLESMEKQLEDNKAQLAANNEEMKTFRDRDAEFDKMLEYWRELHKMNFKYIPQKDDTIDAKLADFINKSDSDKRMKCLFVRVNESQQVGHYSYFTKKVIMKVENNNLIIRVGGGFMSIDEFIEQHNPISKHLRHQGIAHPFQSSMQTLPQCSSQKNFQWTNRKHSYDGTSTRLHHQGSNSNLHLVNESRQICGTQRDQNNGSHSVSHHHHQSKKALLIQSGASSATNQYGYAVQQLSSSSQQTQQQQQYQHLQVPQSSSQQQFHTIGSSSQQPLNQQLKVNEILSPIASLSSRGFPAAANYVVTTSSSSAQHHHHSRKV